MHAGLFGIGGGSIMTPSLALLTPLSQHAVIGTSLASMVRACSMHATCIVCSFRVHFSSVVLGIKVSVSP